MANLSANARNPNDHLDAPTEFPTAAALRLPDDNCYAIHPPKALRAAKRKTGISMPEIQIRSTRSVPQRCP